MSQNLDSLAATCDLSACDRERLTLYLDSGQDPRVLAGKAGISLFDAITWIAAPSTRRALATWDYANRRARAVRDEADRRLAIDALKAVCQDRLAHRSHRSHDTHPCASPAHLLTCSPAHAASGTSSTHHEAAQATSDLPLTEVRRAATTILRTLNGGMGQGATARRGHGAAHARHRKPRRISDFTFSDPAEAERLLEKERRENDRLAALIHQTTALADSIRPSSALAGGALARGDSPRARTEGAASPAVVTPAAAERRQDTGYEPPRSGSAAVAERLSSPRSRAARLAISAGRVPAPTNTS